MSDANRLMTAMRINPGAADEVPRAVDTSGTRINELRLIARDRATAETALGLDIATGALYGWVFVAVAKRKADGTIYPISNEQWAGFEDCLADWGTARAAFESAVRVELERDPLTGG